MQVNINSVFLISFILLVLRIGILTREVVNIFNNTWLIWITFSQSSNNPTPALLNTMSMAPKVSTVPLNRSEMF